MTFPFKASLIPQLRKQSLLGFLPSFVFLQRALNLKPRSSIGLIRNTAILGKPGPNTSSSTGLGRSDR